MSYMFYIKIEECLIQTLTRSRWYNETPWTDRGPPNLGVNNQIEEEEHNLQDTKEADNGGYIAKT
jgi:hypothetical protein